MNRFIFLLIGYDWNGENTFLNRNLQMWINSPFLELFALNLLIWRYYFVEKLKIIEKKPV